MRLSNIQILQRERPHTNTVLAFLDALHQLSSTDMQKIVDTRDHHASNARHYAYVQAKKAIIAAKRAPIARAVAREAWGTGLRNGQHLITHNPSESSAFANAAREAAVGLYVQDIISDADFAALYEAWEGRIPRNSLPSA